jgi:hypothetical protein
LDGIKYEPEGTPIDEMFSNLLSNSMNNEKITERPSPVRRGVQKTVDLKSTAVLDQPAFLLVLVLEVSAKRYFSLQTRWTLKAQRVTAAAVSSHDATSPTLRFA